MAGLFDLFSEDPQQAAYMALAAGLLGGKGSFNSILGQSLLGAQQAYGGASDSQMKRQLIKAQMGDIAAQEQLRKAQAEKMAAAQKMLEQVLGQQAQTSPSQYGVGGSGINMGGVTEPMVPTSKKAGLAGASAEQIAALKAQGMDISNIWELAQFGKQMQPGYRQGVGGTMDYFAKPGEPTVNTKTGQVSLPPGAAESVGALAGATTGAQESAKAPYQLVSYLDEKGAQRQKPLAQILQELKTEQPSQYSLPSGGFTLGSNTGDAIRIRQQELASASNPEDRAAIERDISRLQTKPMTDVRYPGSASAPTTSGGLKTGLSPDEQATAAATKEYQTNRAKQQATDMGSIQEKGIAAPTRIATIKQIGDLYAGFEGGTLSEFAKKVASTANSLGIKIDPKLGDKEAAAAISNKLAIELRNTGQGSGMPGALSDSDREFLRSMTPQLGQTAAGRQMIINAHVSLAQRDADIAKFARNYENKYGKLDNGFFNQLTEWSKANPLFK